MNSGKGAASSKTETEDEGINGTGKAFFGAVAGAALVAWGIGSALFSSPEPDPGKTMKAPGRDYRNPRADFERDPKSYFKGLRSALFSSPEPDPVKTVKAPGKTMKAPEKTMKAPGKTMKAPEKTMKAPGKTMKAPGKTMKAPEKTMKAPGKTMKAPGRDHRMPRADFERDPKSYFKDLRK